MQVREKKGYWGAKLLGDRVCDTLERERVLGGKGTCHGWERESLSWDIDMSEWVSEW